MNILFLTVARITDISERGIYTDLMRKFRDEGHRVYIASPSERRYKQKTSLIKKDNVHVLNVKTLNVQKTNIAEKGIATLLLEIQFLNAIKKYYSDVKFDLVLYSTPPITYTKVIKYIKKRDIAHSYLLLKDIFPQNAVDMGMMREGGVLHNYFRKKEKNLYQVSDYIGCMSHANVDFIVKHNKEIDPSKVELNPNTIDPVELDVSSEQRKIIRKKYLIPENAVVFLYGGNLGKPQGIDFLIEVLRDNMNNSKLFFLIVGSGTEYKKVKEWFDMNSPSNALLIEGLPKKEYDELAPSCDVGLIFLDKRFTIPNFPSRLLSYMESKMPVLAATDKNTDVGKVIMDNHFGYWVESGDLQGFNNYLNFFVTNEQNIRQMGDAGFLFLKKNYTTENSYHTIINHF